MSEPDKTVTTTNPPSTATVTVKPGWATSEHAMSYAAILLSGLFGAGVIPSTGPLAQVFVIVAIALTAAGYTVSRGLVKS